MYSIDTAYMRGTVMYLTSVGAKALWEGGRIRGIAGSQYGGNKKWHFDSVMFLSPVFDSRTSCSQAAGESRSL